MDGVKGEFEAVTDAELDFGGGVAYIRFIVTEKLKDQIIEQVDRLDAPRQPTGSSVT